MTFLAVAAFSSFSWEGMGMRLANHLWQSTVFGGVVWLLTLLLRKNHAQARYLLWLLASAKFLIPFSLLTGLGSHLARSKMPAITQPEFLIAIQTVGQPFSSTSSSPISSTAPSSSLAVALRFLPVFLLVAWLCGCLAVFCLWWLRWRRLRMARRAGLLAKSGRELEALRRVGQSGRRSGQIGVILCESALEPGILGVFHPVLLLPAGISERLNDEQLNAILIHELCHVRRRDNLASALHMLIEAVFWFYPLVWWIGARLVDERERACDEEVLKLGTDPQVYAEGILNVCNFYLESPLFCAAGVTGSNLKKRIEAIMRNRLARNLGWTKKLLLATMGVAAVAVPIMFGLLHTSQGNAQSQGQDSAFIASPFESVSIKRNTTDEPIAGFSRHARKANSFEPDRFMATNVSLHALIAAAYAIGGSEILGGPDWVRSENYDIEAKLNTPVIDELSTLGPDQRALEQKRVLQALLADRFRLALHRETREPPAYVLAIARDGFKLQEAKPGDTYPDGLKDPQGRPLGARALWQPGPCKLVGQGVHMSDLANTLSMNDLGGRTVVDQTGLRGVYDFTLDCHTAFMERGESVLTVLPEQLGLELKLLDNLVIDSAEKPSEN